MNKAREYNAVAEALLQANTPNPAITIQNARVVDQFGDDVVLQLLNTKPMDLTHVRDAVLEATHKLDFSEAIADKVCDLICRMTYAELLANRIKF